VKSVTGSHSTARCWPRCSLTVASDVPTQWPKDGFAVIKTYHETII
jgi:hypothetical protein